MTKLEELRAQGPVKRLAGKLQGQGQGEAAAEGEGAAVLDGGEEQAEAAALRAVDPEEALAAVPKRVSQVQVRELVHAKLLASEGLRAGDRILGNNGRMNEAMWKRR